MSRITGTSALGKGAVSLSLRLPLPPRSRSRRRSHPIQTSLPFLPSWIQALVISNRKVPEQEGRASLAGPHLSRLPWPTPLTSPPHPSSLPSMPSAPGDWPGPCHRHNCPNRVQRTVFWFLARPTRFVTGGRISKKAGAAPRPGGVRPAAGRKVTSAASGTPWLCPAQKEGRVSCHWVRPDLSQLGVLLREGTQRTGRVGTGSQSLRRPGRAWALP